MRLWTVLLLAIVLGVGLQVALAAMPALGSAAPDFTLPSQDGTPVSLKDLHGKWVVLYFYPKDGTPGCTIEAHNFQRDQAQYAQRNAMVVGVSVDTTDSHKEFCSKEGLNFKLLADTDHKVVKLYDSTMTYAGVEIAARNTFIIDPQGKIQRAYTSVDPNKHSQEVLAALDELQKSTSASKLRLCGTGSDPVPHIPVPHTNSSHRIGTVKLDA